MLKFISALSKKRNHSRWTFLVPILFICSCNKTSEEIQPQPQPAPNPLPGPTNISCSGNIVHGYFGKTSYLPGESATLYLQAKATLSCDVAIKDVKNTVVHNIPISLYTQTTATKETYRNGFGYKETIIFTMPSLPSGIYHIENKIWFVVKNSSPADMVIVYPSNTINAYSTSGGKSLYSYNSSEAKAAVEVSWLRPMDDEFQRALYAGCLTWFKALPYSIHYIADEDLEKYDVLDGSKIIVLIGHSEYWTRQARKNFDRFVNEGNDALILSGNVMWWQVRYNSPRDRMICHKNANTDTETDAKLKTILWTEPSLEYHILESIGMDFEHGGYGLQQDDGWNGYKICEPNSPLLKNLSLKKGDIVSLPSGEYDGMPLLGFTNGYPIPDRAKLNFYKVEIIGFDKGSRAGKETIGTFAVMQKKPSSGIIVHGGSYGWCASQAFSQSTIQTITRNAIDVLIKNENPFSPNVYGGDKAM